MREAVIPCQLEVLSGLLSLLGDGGLTVKAVGSGPVRLPEACEGSLKSVRLTIRTEVYGSQRLNRIDSIDVVDKPKGRDVRVYLCGIGAAYSVRAKAA